MKKAILMAVLCLGTITYAQITTSFEEPSFFGGLYTDTGDASIAHDLLNNPNEPLVAYTASGGELGFVARYEPYNTPGSGLTDGDAAGVTTNPPAGTNPYPDGLQGYQISDVDGNFILTFDAVLVTSPTILVDYFIAETGYEGDGTINASGSDRLRIYVKNLNDNTEYDLLNTTGNDINDLNIEGVWKTANTTIENSPKIMVQLIIEARTNSAGEAFYFDTISIDGLLGIEDHLKNQFLVTPNPAQNFVDIQSNIVGNKKVHVFNILGEQVMEATMTSNRLDISTLNSGVYIIKIQQGKYSVTKKLVVN